MKLKRKLPDFIDSYLKYTERTEPVDQFKTWTAISVIASALQRKVFMEWGPSLVFYPNLYIVLVAPSGSRKSVAMNPGLSLITDAGIPIASNATTWQALVRKLKDNNMTDVEPETGTVHCHSSLTIFSKEFTVFLGFQNRELMSSLCDWYDCDNIWSYDTISRNEEKIIGVWVNLMGATTPSLIRESLPTNAIGGGLTSRIIFVYGKGKGKTISIPSVSIEEKELYKLLLHDLEQIKMLSGQFKATRGFVDAWHIWYTQTSDAEPVFKDPRLEGYVERRPTHLMKLAMIMSVSRGGNDLVVTEKDLGRALSYLVEAETSMFNVFEGIGKSSIAGTIQDVLTYILINKHREIPLSDIAQRFYSDADYNTMQNILHTIQSMSKCKIIKRPGTGKEDVIVAM
jgi:hypothetical protein